MAATSSRRRAVAALSVVAVAAALLAPAASADDGNGVYDPCADASVQRGDGFSFGVAFAGLDAFSSGGVRLSPCDSRLGLASGRAHLAVFRPSVDEISLLTVNTSSTPNGAPVDLASPSGGYMVAFAGRKYAARSLPVFVSNISYTVTSFTLVFEFKKGTLENLFWKADGCSSCSGQSDFACVEESCAVKTTSCRGKGGQVECSPGIQLAFSGTDRHDAVLNSWYEVSKLRQYSLFGLFSNLKDSLTSQFSSCGLFSSCRPPANVSSFEPRRYFFPLSTVETGDSQAISLFLRRFAVVLASGGLVGRPPEEEDDWLNRRRIDSPVYSSYIVGLRLPVRLVRWPPGSFAHLDRRRKGR